MIEVEAPDGTIVEFPAGTSREVMRDAMRRRFSQPQAPQANLDVYVTAGRPDLPLPPPATPQPATAGRSFAQGVMDPIQGGAQFLTNALPEGVVSGVNRATQAINDAPYIGPLTRALGMVPATRESINRQTSEREQAYNTSRDFAGDTGIDWWRSAGNVASSLPAAFALPAGRSILGSVAAGAATGAGMSALQPVDTTRGDYWDEKKSQTETGGMLGAVTGPVGYTVGRIISPQISPQVRTLANEGVEMTPGQLMGGVVQRVESGARGLPFVGDPIVAAQNQSLRTFNRATGNRVLAPLGETLPDNVSAGRDMVAHLQDRVSDVYRTTLSQARPFGPDAQFATDIATTGQRFLTPESRNAFTRFLQDRVVSRLQQGPISGAEYQTIRSELGQEAIGYASSLSQAEREIGRAMFKVQDAFDTLFARQNPAIAPRVQAANEAFSTLQRVNVAAGGAGAIDGVFNAAQLSRAVQSQDRSIRGQAFARGDALLQDLSDAGKGVLPNTVADSGTGFRGGLMGLMVGSSAGVSPMAGAALVGGTAAAYSDPARRALTQYLLANRPYSARVVGDALAYSGGAVATPLAASMLTPSRPPSRP